MPSPKSHKYPVMVPAPGGIVVWSMNWMVAGAQAVVRLAVNAAAGDGETVIKFVFTSSSTPKAFFTISLTVYTPGIE